MLVRMILDRQPLMDERMAYYSGQHREPKGSKEYMAALRQFKRLATTNYIGLITTAPVERMYVRGFRFGDVGAADDEAKQIWACNDMDMQQTAIHQHAAIFGLGYALVTPPDDDSDGYPIITVEDPRTAIVYHDPMRPNKRVAGLRLWQDDLSGRVLAILYRPEGAYGFLGPQGVELQNMTLFDLKNRLLGLGLAGGGFEPAGFIPNPDGFSDIPLVEYIWRPNSGQIPWGECDYSLQVIQDRLNQTVYDRIAISYFQAYRQRYATGIKTDQGGRKNPQGEAPFRPGVNTFWATQSPDAKFGEFSTADITQILEAIRDDISDMAAISKTPAHYLMGKMANISGETLTQVESGLTSKTQIRMTTMGWSHIQVMKLCFAFMGNMSKYEDHDAATMWSDPGKQLTADLALAGQQWSAIGIPLELIMERQGFAPDEIAFAVKKKAEADQQAQDQQLTMMKAQAALAPKPAPGGASTPAKQPGVNKKSVAAKNPKPKKASP